MRGALRGIKLAYVGVNEAAWTFWGIALLIFVSQRMRARAIRADLQKQKEWIETLRAAHSVTNDNSNRIASLTADIQKIVEIEERGYVTYLESLAFILAFPIVVMAFVGIVKLFSGSD